MSAPSPSDHPPAAERPAFWRRLLGWLFGRDPKKANSSSADNYFAAVADGRESLSPPVPAVLKPSKSSRNSPLAKAYAAASAPPPPVESAGTSPAARWQVVEPPADPDPVPHQEHKFDRRDGWSLVAASVRGRQHAHYGSWRDDAFAFARADDWNCIAVADGAGSAVLSRIGARVACDCAVTALSGALAGWRPQLDAEAPAQGDLQRLRVALATAAREAQSAVAAEAERRGQPLRDFNTTLLLAAHIPLGDADLVAGFQVGDGTIALYCDPGMCLPLGGGDHGAYGGETLFLTTPGVEEECERRTFFTWQRGLRALALMTDGVADDFFPAERLPQLFDGDPIAGLTVPGGGPLHGVLRAVIPEPRDGQALADWLQYEKRGSSDDRTLALLCRVEGAP
jgi:hypothetical protein